MVRSKQTGPKTMGEPAKRRELPQFKTVKGHAGTTIIKTMSSKTMLPSSVKLVLKPYCFFCHDGGSLYDCSKCPRTVCHKCVIIPKEFIEQVMGDDIHFICPGCHESQGQCQGDDAIIAPYFGFVDHEGYPAFTVPAVIHGHIEATSRSQVCSNPILILHFVLQSLQPSHSPAAIMQQELQLYRPNDIIQYHKITFDFRTMEKFFKHTQAMTNLVERIKHIEYERIEVFVYTHSETVQGNLWGGFKENETIGRGKSKKTILDAPVVYTVNHFFAGLFVGRVADYIKGSTLWMLACGHTVREPDTFKSFKNNVKCYEVKHAFAFGAEPFHACLTTPLVTTYVDRVLIEGFEVQEVMQDLLLACPRLAKHSFIIHLHVTNNAFHCRRPTMAEYKQGMIHTPGGTTSMAVTTYTFFHENNCPFGNALPYQCSKCMCICTWQHLASCPSAPNESKCACKNLKCGHTITYMMLKQSHIILFSQGYRGTSTVSGKLVKKGHNAAGSGWLVSQMIEGGMVTDDDSPADSC
ncbi:hypothetical protein BD769DRAFT_1669259 [Suillus cothurnatus]|nr:hypothetical protein BD769DRAFT_1669259 [Suillus cothurnatus]